MALLPGDLPNFTPNARPDLIFNKKVEFSTVNTINNTSVSEIYSVSNPSSPGVFVIVLSSGNKAVVPLTDRVDQGAPYLKFHFPSNSFVNPNKSKTMYMTFCVKNLQMADGFYDYTTGIPGQYRSVLKNWIANNTIVSSGNKSRFLKFTSYGLDTNKPQEAVTFYISFQANFTQIEAPVVASEL